MGKGLEQTLLQGGHTEGPETYEKMLSITSPERYVKRIFKIKPNHIGEHICK